MDKIPLKIIIAGRTYPLTIKKEEEAIIKAAAERINSNIKKLQGSYAVKDMQDLLAMTSLQLAVQSNNSGNTNVSVQSQPDFSEDIQKIIEKLDKAL
ncbi:cell division protein ZapA [Paracrocinitomix mangrovi]|uniref:cell division protein ZapA n=1 Tax=Paracrocinitomix mangrovi TaxID=2862509 RepID=UPI001C8E72CA|nr:cell division protein ZapA [Paracrocinitomix mangrovi]UKN03313.1 cell division protein ZapA [Paracrocinitomix mangrovi]